MELRNYLRVSSLLLLCLLLTNCGFLRKPEKEIIVQTVEIQKRIPLQNQPKPKYSNTSLFADDGILFKEEFSKTNESFVFYAVSVHDYENLALNFAEIFRYIKQQKEIIIYYEKAVTDKPEEKIEEEKK